MIPVLSLLVLLPAVGSITLLLRREERYSRRIASVFAGASFLLSAWVALRLDGASGAIQFEEVLFRLPVLGVRWRLGVDGLSALFLPTANAVALAIILGSPRASLDRRNVAAMLGTLSASLGILCSLDLALLGVFWVMRLIPGRWVIPWTPTAAVRDWFGRTWSIFLWGGSLPLLPVIIAVGVVGHRAHALTPFDYHEALARGIPDAWQLPLFLCVMLAIFMRLAIAPFHAWLPLLMEHGPYATGTLIATVPVPLYLFARVVVPLFPHGEAVARPVIIAFAVWSAFYGATLAIAQRGLRRMLGFIAVSHSGFALMGLATLNHESIHGALLESAASSLSLAGLLVLVRGLHARTGTSNADELGGIASQSPRMTVAFVIFAVASLGFPGTMTFVSEDLLFHGVLALHPGVATALLVTTAINAIALLRAFLRTFLGRPRRVTRDVPVDDLGTRERVAVLALCGLVIVGGLRPQPLLDLRAGYVRAQVADHDEAHPHPMRHDDRVRHVRHASH